MATRKRSAKPTKIKRTAGEWKPAFLAALRISGNVRYACEKAGIDRTAAYDERDRNEVFRQCWQLALEEAIDSLEKAAWERAKHRSDTLLIFLLKSHRRNVYGDRVEHDGAVKLLVTEEIIDGNCQDNPAPPQAV